MGNMWTRLVRAKDSAVSTLTQGLEITVGAFMGGLTGLGINTNSSPWMLFGLVLLVSVNFVLLINALDLARSGYREPDTEERLEEIENKLEILIDQEE